MSVTTTEAPPHLTLSPRLQALLVKHHADRIRLRDLAVALDAPEIADDHDGEAADLRAELSAHGCEMLAARLAATALNPTPEQGT